MTAPPTGARIRMYRQGQGDCFLIAFPRLGADPDNPVYLLIDCGIMYGSEIKEDVSLEEVIDHIHDATGGRIDYVVVTHEHADHVNGFNKKRNGQLMWEAFDHIGQIWLAWTEDEEDEFANQLRAEFGDTLLALVAAEEKMAALDDMDGERTIIRQLLSMERDEEEDREALMGAAAGGGSGMFAIDGITNKRAIKFLRDKAQQGPLFLRPGQPAFEIDGADGARAYVLGPPRDRDLLVSLNPRGDEEFHAAEAMEFNDDFVGFRAALTSGGVAGTSAPFAARYTTSVEKVKAIPKGEVEADFHSADPNKQARVYAAHVYEGIAAKEDEAWRRIDGRWLAISERLALRLNHEVNNTSLVLAFELPETGKVLLFTGDAQRGNWMSWSDLTWDRDGQSVDAKELLGRCVFYKCGHHGSHNATLNGEVESDYANLNWLGTHAPGGEFVSMVPVHSDWAWEKNSWTHPLPAIEDALQKKARGRVFLNDVDRVRRPRAGPGQGGLSDEEWETFKDLSIEGKVFKEYVVLDE